MMYMHHVAASESPCACTALRKATRTLDRLYDAALAPYGLTTGQFALLRNIHRAGQIALSRLADALVLDRTSLYRSLRPLEQAGWVRVAAAAQGRTKLAALTEAGLAVMRTAEPAWARLQADINARLGATAWRDMLAIGEKVVALEAKP